jgi:hypothetical protein
MSARNSAAVGCASKDRWDHSQERPGVVLKRRRFTLPLYCHDPGRIAQTPGMLRNSRTLLSR